MTSLGHFCPLAISDSFENVKKKIYLFGSLCKVRSAFPQETSAPRHNLTGPFPVVPGANIESGQKSLLAHPGLLQL